MKIQLPESIKDSILHQELTARSQKAGKQMDWTISWRMLRQFIKYLKWIHICLNLSMNAIWSYLSVSRIFYQSKIWLTSGATLSND